jgi:hypothetical protein
MCKTLESRAAKRACGYVGRSHSFHALTGLIRFVGALERTKWPVSWNVFARPFSWFEAANLRQRGPSYPAEYNQTLGQ